MILGHSSTNIERLTQTTACWCSLGKKKEAEGLGLHWVALQFVAIVVWGVKMGDMEAGFAKLQGEDFEYYMQTYSIVLGRNSKKASVDVDLAGLGGGMNISRHHAKIAYDFQRRRFVLEVLGKNGCFVEGVHHPPENPPVKLDSQDLLQIGEKRFYFLLPAKQIARSIAPVVASPANPNPNSRKRAAGGPPRRAPGPPKKERGGQVTGSHQEELEEREIVQTILQKLQTQHTPGEWMAVARLHGEVLDHFQSRVLSPQFQSLMGVDEEGQIEMDGKGGLRPWAGLVNLLKKYPGYFAINAKLKGGIRVEYVSLITDDQ